MDAIDPLAGVAKDAAYFGFWWKVVLTIGVLTVVNAGLAALQVWVLFRILRRLE